MKRAAWVLALVLTGAGAEPPADVAALTVLLTESERLAHTLEGLQTQLKAVAERSAAQADLALTADERQRYEALAQSAQDRLAELKTTRAALQREIALLRARLERAEPDEKPRPAP